MLNAINSLLPKKAAPKKKTRHYHQVPVLYYSVHYLSGGQILSAQKHTCAEHICRRKLRNVDVQVLWCVMGNINSAMIVVVASKTASFEQRGAPTAALAT